MSAATGHIEEPGFYGLLTKAHHVIQGIMKEGEYYFTKKYLDKQLKIIRDQHELFIDVLTHHDDHLEEYSLADVDHLYENLKEVYDDVADFRKFLEKNKDLTPEFSRLFNTFLKFEELFYKVHERARLIAEDEEKKQMTIASMKSLWRDWDQEEDEYWNSFLK